MTARIKTAFILGAGLGRRLRPLTDRCPKPLLPVAGRPMITYAMDHLIGVGVERFIVNTHHLAHRFHEAFPRGRWRGVPITFRHEPVLLDTAGGLKNIEDLLHPDDGEIFVYNGDILSDLPLRPLLAAHGDQGREVTVALRSGGPSPNVGLDEGGRIVDFRFSLGRRAARLCQFTGIYIVARPFLRRLAPGKIQDIVPVFIDLVRQEAGAVGGVVIDEGRWCDVGTVAAYEALRDEGMGRVHAPFSEYGAPLGLGDPGGLEVEMMEGGGSNRVFHRLRWRDGSAVVMVYDAEVRENRLFAPLAAFLKARGVPVPALLHHDPRRAVIVMEDLGERDLWSCFPEGEAVRGPLYRRALEAIKRLHSIPPGEARAAGIELPPPFDADLYAWERDYFRVRFLEALRGIRLTHQEAAAFDEGGRKAAEALLAGPSCLIHRDFQSRNIMVRRDDVFLVDFQGLRLGSPLYDLASLLWDPYVDLPGEEREEYLKYYHRLDPSVGPWREFRRLFHLAAAQRLMQALGAYGYLGLVRGRPWFLDQIPRALSKLGEVVLNSQELDFLEPVLRKK
ncbi:MAG TPA: phosphotransferase [Syntrophales bacterium]|nr:phosphotransferase [Syntrophales bacterium]